MGAREDTYTHRPVSLGPAPKMEAAGAGRVRASGTSIHHSSARDQRKPTRSESGKRQLSAGAITNLKVWFPRSLKLGLLIEWFRGIGRGLRTVIRIPLLS